MTNLGQQVGMSMLGCGCSLILLGLLLPFIFIVVAAIIVGSAE